MSAGLPVCAGCGECGWCLGQSGGTAAATEADWGQQ
jgi:hypothetical protein